MKVLGYFMIFLLIIFGSVYYFFNAPKKVNTIYNSSDYRSFIEKIGINNFEEIKEENKVSIKDLLYTNFIDNSPVELNNVNFTAPELAAFVNESINNDVINNFNIAFTDEDLIITFNLADDTEPFLDILPELKIM